MLDGSDAIADWPILNALLNTAAGATWVSVHHGGGVGIGNSIHSGMVVLADGTADAADRLERVLTRRPRNGRDAARRRRLPGGARCCSRGRARPAERRLAGGGGRGAGGGVDCGGVGTVPSRPWRACHDRPADPRSRAGCHPGRQWPASRRVAPRRPGDRRRIRALPRRADRGGRRDARSLPLGRRAAGVRRRRSRGDRRPRPLCHSGPRRLSHARLLRRRSGQRVLAAGGRCLVRGAPRRRRRHPLDRSGDSRRR